MPSQPVRLYRVTYEGVAQAGQGDLYFKDFWRD